MRSCKTKVWRRSAPAPPLGARFFWEGGQKPDSSHAMSQEASLDQHGRQMALRNGRVPFVAVNSIESTASAAETFFSSFAKICL